VVTALNLCRAGLPVTVLESGDTVCRDMRAPAFHAPTIDMLEDIGLLEKLLPVASIERVMRFSDRGLGKTIAFDMGVLGRRYRHPYDMLVGQQWLTRMAYEMLQAHDCEFLFSHKVVGASQSSDSVTVVAATQQGEKRFTGSWLLGCDGANSPVRSSQQIEFEGYTWPERFLMIHTQHDFSGEFGRVNFIADGPKWQLVVKIPFGPGADDWLVRIVSSVPADARDDQVLSPENLQANLQRLSTRQPHWPITGATIYNIHQRVAKTFRKGRIVLLGDAAHVNNPIGAQGLNSGIHDAMNLAPKLLEVWRHPERVALLDLYDRQRRQTNWEFIQKISVENKQRNEETDLQKRAGAIAFMKTLVDNDDARFAFLDRWSMGESLDYAARIT
jgi:3-(3-hydroxy-phenyl)propionate hydroxylase